MQPQSSSNNKTGLYITLVILALIGTATYLFLNRGNSTSQDTATTNTSSTSLAGSPESNTNDTPSITVGEPNPTSPIAVEGGEFYFSPNEIKAKVGVPITITFTSKGKMMHDFVLDEFSVQSKTLKDSESETITFTPTKAGTFEFYCSVGSHRKMGMKGNLIVE